MHPGTLDPKGTSPPVAVSERWSGVGVPLGQEEIVGTGTRRFGAFIAAAAIVATASPAGAKGAESLTIAGAGLGGAPIVLESERGWEDLAAIAEQTRFFELTFAVEAPDDEHPWSAFAISTRGTQELGPRLRLSWEMYHDGSASGEDVPLRQDLYLYAGGGPLVYTAVQEVYGQPVPGGWHRADPALIDTLQALGVPDAAELRGRALAMRWPGWRSPR